jgi:HAD superfamily hydrolase (TIGR01509 family)
METFGVLWDLDGVLADSTALHYRSWKAILDPRGIAMDETAFKRVFGRNNRATLTDLIGHPPAEDLLKEISTKKEQWFRDHIPGNVGILPGVRDWLERFQSWGFAQAIASSAPSQNITAQVDTLGIRPFFQVLGSAADLPSKPDPAVFVDSARELGVPPARCLVIEDSPAGVEGAHRAGMKVVAVLTTQTAQVFKEADLIVNRLTDLRESEVRELLGIRE